MYIQHQNFVIRNAEEKDSALLARWWNDGKVMAHAGFPNGLGTTPEAVAEQLRSDTDETRRRLMMEKNGVPIGEMSYTNLGGTAEIGVKICVFSEQEKGAGRVLLSMLIGRLFSLGYGKIVLDTNLKNTRAQHVYELLGFRRLRVNTDAWRDQLGRLQSSVDYELAPEEFHDFTKT